MLPQLRHKTVLHSALSIALLLKVFDVVALPAAAKSGDTLGLQSQDLAVLSSDSLQAAQPGFGKCPNLSNQISPPVQVASNNPNFLIAQTAAPSTGGGSCPADFTSIPCGTGSELFCEVGGLADGPVGGGLLAPLALAGSGFPFGALAPLALAPLGFLGGDSGSGGGGGGGTPPPDSPPGEPIPEPSMIPAAALALGFIYLHRRSRHLSANSQVDESSN
jgi:hypothetical protein